MGDDGEEDGEEDVYLVRREAGADPVPVARSRLRHRVIEKQCHPVISDDKTHDSYAMQCFVAKAIQHLKGDAPGGSGNVISKQGLTSLRIHSDNAKQHFKSSKSIYFFTKQLVGGSGGFGFTSITWDFGAPGHGKGVWDGLGGMLKQWLRTRIVSALSYDPHSGDPDPLAACAEPGSDKCGRIDKAHDCYLLLRSYFELGESGITWRSEQAAKGGAVSSMYFHWASYHQETKELRPKNPVGHHTVDGISSSYQYYMERDCHVLMRKHSCWCRACRRVARRTAGALSASFKVSGCERTGSYYEWTNKMCGPKSGSDGASAVTKRTQERGHELAAGGDLAVGSWVLVECFSDKEDDMWLGKVVNSVDLGGACKKKHVGKAQHIKGTRYDGGDWRVAVMWYERAGDDDERLAFREPPSDAGVDFFNSTELHLVMLGGGGGAPAEVQRRKHLLRLPGETEANGRAWCR